MRIFYTLLFLCFGLIVFAQDECSTAPYMVLNPGNNACSATHFTVPLSGATVSSTLPAPTCGWGAGKKDVWYRFIVPPGVTKMTFGLGNTAPLVGFPGTAKKPCMTIYKGNCSTLTKLGCWTTPSGFLSDDTRGFSFKNVTVVPGDTLYCRMWEQGNNAAINLDLIISTTQTAPTNSACANATTLSSVGCNVNAPGGSMAAPESCTGASGESAVWGTVDNIVYYKFTVTSTTPQPVKITLQNVTCAGGCNTIQLALYKGTCANIGGSNNSATVNPNFRGCNQGVGTVTVTANQNPLANGNYILAVDGCSSGLSPTETSACMFGITSSVLILPVELADFKATYFEEENKVWILWTTLSEMKSERFIVERSTDAINFTSIGEVRAAGSSNQRIDYTMDDDNIGYAEATYFYRLKQIDIDGSYSYSEMVQVRTGSTAPKYSIYPNPVTQGYFSTSFFNYTNVPLSLKLVNSMGQVVYDKQYTPELQDETLHICTNGLGNGLYFFKMTDQDGNHKSSPVLVQN